VIEPDAANLAMALRLHDFSRDLAARRLWPLVGEAAWEQLRAALLAEPGLLPPDRVLAWPWFTPAESHDLRTRLTTLATEVGRHRENALRALRDGAGPLTPRPFRECRSIVVVSIQPDPDRAHIARGVAWGLTESGRRAQSYCVDSPTRVHALALGRFIRNESPDAVILIDATRGELGGLLPDGVGVATWLSPKGSVDGGLASRLGADDRLIVGTAEQAEAARAAGIAPDRVALAPPAGRPTGPRERRALVVIADGADVRPQAAGVHLASHVALWNAAARVIGARADGYFDSDFERLFEQAEVECGVRISEATVRGDLRDRIRTVLGPALLNRAYIDALLDANVAFDLYGDGWAGLDDYTGVHCGRRPDGAVGYASALHVTPSGAVTGELLDAVANGAAPLIRGNPHRRAEPYFDGESCAGFRDRGELVALAGRDLRGVGARAAERVLAQHTWKQRLAGLMA
jgi:hypothetical protein